MTARARVAVLAAVLAATWVFAPGAAASAPADEAALAARYAPVVRLVDQPERCGPGEPYVPIDVNLLFDEPTVALRGPWTGANLVKVGPSAGDLGAGLYGYHLGYPGQIALQYWMFYVYNDWNNLHEGDWEMIQINFPASSAAEALKVSPSEVGYSQHEGGERASWDDPKLERVDGTHPVVYRADAVPAGGALGTRTTDFFCSAMARGSRLLWVAVGDPLPTIIGVLAAVALLIYALSRATWRPTAPLRVARRRAWGQILSGAARMYVAQWRLFIGIGVLLLPVSVLITILQAIVFHASSFAGVETEGEAAGAFVLVVVAIGTALTLLGFGIVQSATARALVEIDDGRPVGAVQAYRMAFSSLAPV